MRPKKTESNPRYDALIGLLRASESLWNASRVFFVRWNLGPSQFNVLKLLHDHPEACTQTELSRALLVHRSNVTGLLNRLERRKLIVRRDNDADRRAYRVEITAGGRKLVERILPHYHHAAEQMWGDLPEKRVRQIVDDLSQVSRNADRSSKPTPITPTHDARA